MGRDVIVACDFNSKKEVMSFLDKFTDRKPYVKIGMELFYAEGPAIVKEIKERGHKIFLDLFCLILIKKLFYFFYIHLVHFTHSCKFFFQI